MKPNLDVQLHVLTILADSTTNQVLTLDELPRKNFSLGQLSYAVEMLLEQRFIRAKSLQTDTDEHTSFIIHGLTIGGRQYLASLAVNSSFSEKLRSLLKRIWKGFVSEGEKQIYQWIIKGYWVYPSLTFYL
ncbi:hypothetical protein MJ923_02345 [Shewanella sp. 3B26]|uniref:Uncharacterized protein n=1 Tax=Shewanella zhuhaiensis TaxID=2919576 RepID=A0AAJ1BEE6_9GAMM|nr:hypothetical protein [Shewanella zhuhaiensis]MCH4293143.1 hypothetical protein [Shewanella zhuhaiensis]